MQQLTGNNFAMRWLYSGMASAAVLVLGVFISVQIPTQRGGGDFGGIDSLEEVVQVATPMSGGRTEFYNLTAPGEVQMESSRGIVAQAEPPPPFPVQDVLEARVVVAAGAALDAVDLVALVEEELCQVGTVLSRDAGDECFFHNVRVKKSERFDP